MKNIGDLYRGLYDFKKGHQLRNNIVKGENHGLVADDSHRFLASWRKYFSQLLNVYDVNDFRRKEIHTTEPLVPEPSAEIAIEKLKRHKSHHLVLIKSQQN